MQLYSWIIVVFNLLLLPALLTNAQRTCENLYDRYCELLSPQKCYFIYNQKLCCSTCLAYHQMYLYAATEDEPCDFGDRREDCSAMPSDLCYKRQHRKHCCGTCAQYRLDEPYCEFGDKKAHECTKVKPYMCYQEEVESKCCGTCLRYNTGRKDCPYGDKIKFFGRNRKKYSCAAYVGHFGTSRCRFPWDPSFRQICCGSCYDKYSQYKNYYK